MENLYKKDSEVIMMKAKSLLLGFLIGGTAAGISTLLSAPAPGKETRKMIKDNKEALGGQLAELKADFMDLKRSASYASDQGKSALGDFVSDIKYSVSNWQNEIRPQKLELQRDLQSIEQSLTELENSIGSTKSNSQ
jgi:gas vesicle protein